MHERVMISLRLMGGKAWRDTRGRGGDSIVALVNGRVGIHMSLRS